MRKTEEKQVFWEEIESLVLDLLSLSCLFCTSASAVTRALECERLEFRKEL